LLNALSDFKVASEVFMQGLVCALSKGEIRVKNIENINRTESCDFFMAWLID
jgi:hypothetical protein